MHQKYLCLILAVASIPEAIAVTMTSCALYNPTKPAVIETDPTQCVVDGGRDGHAAAISTFFLQSNSGYGSVDALLNTSTYGEPSPDQVQAEALGAFEYGALLITAGPERPGYLRYRFDILTTFNEPDSGITTWIGDTVFDAQVGSGCAYCGLNLFLPITLGRDLSLYFIGRSYAVGQNNHGSTQDYSLMFTVLEADQVTVVADMQIVSTPEPGGLLLVASGLGVFWARRRRRPVSRPTNLTVRSTSN